MTREEYILQRLRDDRAQYRTLGIVCLAATVGAACLGIAMILGGGVGPAIATFSIGATLGGYYLVNRSSFRAVDAAVREIEADPEGLAFPEDYSVATATIIEKAQMPTKTYRQLTIAYGICGVMMVGLGIFLTVLMVDSFGLGSDSENVVFAVLGALLAAGGVLLCILAYQAARNARVSSKFETPVSSAGEDEA